MIQRKYYYRLIPITIVALLLFTIAPIMGGSIEAREKPNIVLIVIDTLRADHLPFYGYKKNTAPFLSEISANGIIFEHAYSTSSWTAPATASIFTSLYPFQHGVTRGFKAMKILGMRSQNIKVTRMPGVLTTITEVLKNDGYTTYGISDNLNVCEKMGFSQGFDWFKSHDNRTAEVINDDLRRKEKTIRATPPYFLYIHYNDPHMPYRKREPWFKENILPKRTTVSAYDSEINYVDEKIKEMFTLFGWEANTLVIVTSDHGEEFWDHRQKGHGKTLYSEVIHVPFLIYFPDGGLKHKRVKNKISTIDILPTVRALIGLPADAHDEGISLAALLEKDRVHLKKQRYIFSHLHKKRKEHKRYKDIVKKSVIRNHWKYIITLPDGHEELYSLIDDPREQFNTINDANAIAQSLKNKLSNFESTCKKYTQEILDIELNKEKLEHLKSLGYLQ